jgi:hypothetical protein
MCITQAAAEARDLLEEVEALRKHEEMTYLAAQVLNLLALPVPTYTY